VRQNREAFLNAAGRHFTLFVLFFPAGYRG
jgi:hypothetical protein